MEKIFKTIDEQIRAFYTEIIKSINMLEKELRTISIDNVLYKMGFPKNYKKLLKLNEKI